MTDESRFRGRAQDGPRKCGTDHKRAGIPSSGGAERPEKQQRTENPAGQHLGASSGTGEDQPLREGKAQFTPVSQKVREETVVKGRGGGR